MIRSVRSVARRLACLRRLTAVACVCWISAPLRMRCDRSSYPDLSERERIAPALTYAVDFEHHSYEVRRIIRAAEVPRIVESQRKARPAVDRAQTNALPARAALMVVKSHGCCEVSGYADLSELDSSEAQDCGSRVDLPVRRSCRKRQMTTPVRQPTPNPITSTAIEINI